LAGSLFISENVEGVMTVREFREVEKLAAEKLAEENDASSLESLCRECTKRIRFTAGILMVTLLHVCFGQALVRSFVPWFAAQHPEMNRWGYALVNVLGISLYLVLSARSSKRREIVLLALELKRPMPSFERNRAE
jgi:hypothetical protein